MHVWARCNVVSVVVGPFLWNKHYPVYYVWGGYHWGTLGRVVFLHSRCYILHMTCCLSQGYEGPAEDSVVPHTPVLNEGKQLGMTARAPPLPHHPSEQRPTVLQTTSSLISQSLTASESKQAESPTNTKLLSQFHRSPFCYSHTFCSCICQSVQHACCIDCLLKLNHLRKCTCYVIITTSSLCFCISFSLPEHNPVIGWKSHWHQLCNGASDTRGWRVTWLQCHRPGRNSRHWHRQYCGGRWHKQLRRWQFLIVAICTPFAAHLVVLVLAKKTTWDKCNSVHLSKVLCKLFRLSQVVFCHLLFASNYQVSCIGQYVFSS